tara:strand:- start:53 stop:304 length:252 start_codon:yes stop_codon:yes gene_type:complete
MTTLNTYAVTYQVDTFETKKEYEQYGADSTEIYDDQFQASSDAQAMKIAERKYRGYKTIDGERVFLVLETLWDKDYEVIEQYI